MGTQLTPEATVARIERLYTLRTNIDQEIAALEQRFAREQEAVGRARKAAIAAAAKLSRRKIAQCGTDSGYYRHLRTLEEPACDACRLAHRVAERTRAERRERGAA